MKIKRVTISLLLVLTALALYYGIGINTLLSLFLAVFVHELSHIAAIYIMGMKINRLCLEFSGLKIEYTGTGRECAELIATLAGPIGGFVFFSTAVNGPPLISTSAKLSLLYSVFNLLPVLPLDGGRALLYAAENRLDINDANCLIRKVSLVFGLIFLILGTLCMLLGEGGGMFAAGIWLLILQSEN